MKTLLIIAILLAALIGVIVFLARNHRQWLERQTPTGVWQSIAGQTQITLQFEGGPREGTYKQLIVSEGKPIREFGHWSALANNLQIVIMATDIKNHPQFGVDTTYNILYVGPANIKINGPDRPGITYKKAPDSCKLVFDEHA